MTISLRAFVLFAVGLSAVVAAPLTAAPVFAWPNWNPGKQAQDAMNRAANSAKKEGGNASSNFQRALSTAYDFQVVNVSGRSVHFDIEYGYSSHPQVPLQSGYNRKYRVTSVQRPVIIFSNGKGQRVRANVTTNAVYRFQMSQGAIVLVRAG